MNFIFGYIVGLLNAILIAILISRYEKKVEKIQHVFKDKVVKKQKGFIVEPDDDVTEFRNELLKKNAKRGLITRLSDLL